MRNSLFSALVSLATFVASAQAQYYTVDFEGDGETKTAYASGTVTLSGIDWDLTETVIGTSATDWKNDLRSARFRGYGTSAMSTIGYLTNGLGGIVFQYRRYGADPQVDWRVEYTTNDVDWVQVGQDFTASANDIVQTFSEAVDNVEGNVRIRIKRATETGTANNRLNVDDICVYPFGETPPAPGGDLPLITVSPEGALKTAYRDQQLLFTVTASQSSADENQETTLAAESLPPGATFAGTTGPAPVSSDFDWTPDATGIYTASFTAADSDGVTTQQVVITVIPAGGILVNFEGTNETKTSYAAGTITLSGYDWDMTEALIGTSDTDWKNGARSARLQGLGTSSMALIQDLTNGLDTIAFNYRRYGTDDQVAWVVEYNVNGGAWVQAGSGFTAPADDIPQTFSATVEAFGNVRVRIRQAAGEGSINARLNIDDIMLVSFQGDPPTNLPPAISLNPPGSSKSVTVGELISFDVTASQIAEEDDITTLSAESLPQEASFTGNSGNPPVSSTFSWTPSSTGVYAIAFVAQDKDGSVTQNVEITVVPVIEPNPATGTVLVAYGFDYTNGMASMLAANLAASDFVSNSNVTYSTGVPGPAASGTGWDTSDHYWEFSLTVDDGFSLTVTNVSFSERASTQGPQAWELRTSLDDFAAPLASGTVQTNSQFDLQEAALDISDATGAVTFRLYGSGAVSASGTWRVDNVTLLGAVVEDGGPVLPQEPQIGSFSMSAGAVSGRFISEAGVNYTLEFTTNIVADPVVWLPAASVAGDGNEVDLSDETPVDAMRMYRIIAE